MILVKEIIGGNDHEEIMDVTYTTNCGWRLVFEYVVVYNEELDIVL